jgi:hypothetical protein
MLANNVFKNASYEMLLMKRWASVSVPETTPGVKQLIALLASMAHGKVGALKDPMLAECINPNPPNSLNPPSKPLTPFSCLYPPPCNSKLTWSQLGN